jgi:hypothetical protein
LIDQNTALIMDAREAFCIAVKFYRSGDWCPALPEFNKIEVLGELFTLRQVCGLVEHVTEPLPNSVVSDLLTSLHARHPRIEEHFAPPRTYAVGAKCLLRLMNDRELTFRQRLEREVV